jgi:hypothetical protein
MIIENKYKEGEVVYERTHPTQKLVVGHYVNGVYYCKVYENPNRKELVYFERELSLDIKLKKTKSRSHSELTTSSIVPGFISSLIAAGINQLSKLFSTLSFLLSRKSKEV